MIIFIHIMSYYIIGNLLVPQITKYDNSVIGVIYYDNQKSQIIFFEYLHNINIMIMVIENIILYYNYRNTNSL